MFWISCGVVKSRPAKEWFALVGEYQKTSTQRNAEMKRLLELLSPEAKEQLEVVETLRYDMNMLSEEDVFICGFRLGARIMLDVMGSNQGQFQTGTAGQ